MLPAAPNVYRYAMAAGFALAAQLTSIPFQTTSVSFIVYAPFVVVSALLGGLGPGLLTTTLCVLGALYYGVSPYGSFVMVRGVDWDSLAALFFTGLLASLLSERLKQSGRRLAREQYRTASILNSIADGFSALDRQWRYTYINPAGARMLGKTPKELLGKSVWQLWPHAADSAFGATYRQAMADNVPIQVEAFYPQPLNAWFEMRCYPAPEGLSLFFTDTTERKQAEEHLRLLESAFVQTTDGILILKVAGENVCCQTPVFANPAFERITGFSLRELQQGAFSQLYRQGANPHIGDGGPSGFRSLCLRRLEQRALRKDGSQFWAEWSFKPLSDRSGRFTHCVWTCRDITQRKRAEEMSRLHSSIVESSDDAIISKDLTGVVLSWNRGAQAIFGYSAEEIVGRPISLLVPPDHPEELRRLMASLKHGVKIEHFETERVHKDGRRILVALTLSPIKDEQGDVVAASAIARDITGKKRAEKALALSEQRYRSLALVTSQIVWTSNPQGQVVEDTPLWSEFTGQSLEDSKGWGWLNAIHPHDRERTRDIWARSLQNGSFYSTEYRVRRRDGEYRYMAVHGVPVFEGAKSIREWVSACADITERVQAEEQVRTLNEMLEKRVMERTAALQTANKELEAFAYSVSHDLRAPLRAVNGFSRILLEEFAPQLPAAAQNYLQVTHHNAVQMGNLIDDLLDFSRLGRQPVHKRKVAPAELVRQALDDLRSEQNGRRIEVILGDLPPCQADPVLLKQVFVNLLSNAFKYTRARDIAKIEIASSAARVYHVRDNGVGFDMRYRNKLFGVFQRLHNAGVYEGTGVGLAIVQRIVQRHGGRVWANAALNRGATFYFTLGGEEEGPAERPAGSSAENPEELNR